MMVCVPNDRPGSWTLDESETGTCMIHQCIHAVALSSFLLSVVTALGQSLDVTVPCHVYHILIGSWM